ncbi:helix-turn-helix domain-containing protein [Serratia proteamaculans]|uniref:helix-turn-helix domain-containing protein n=1 Tax=Serratia proteamaculans TaxID=28151 RepID=UPI0039AF4E5A
MLHKERCRSQEEFADKCGLGRTYVRGIERGVKNPTLEVINMLVIGLNVDIYPGNNNSWSPINLWV